ncbi:MAG: protein kinase [Planctomycetota bacterium]|nr:protein kinase [Planctomycetota bacterium]
MASIIAGAEIGFEPIPGYVLRDKIGVGGYGEVWLADAPGGLKKAIKFVFGSVDEERACNELKSLQIIREVQHPFIISLERIEIVDSHLIVVTELADGSLLDRFREFHERGLIGIPRERLIEYMKDTADALDFLCQRHDLQHLDVKPANLLLVADRIKVADFGLIKDVQRNSMSLMGGMTPTYAAPEMFDGRPGRYSDQYSLAIVYQEMLTGGLPFRGRTTAQLATEHLHKAPNLEELPAAERPVIARALSKKPSQRFGSCRDMIDALIAAHQQSLPNAPASGNVPLRKGSRKAVAAKSTPVRPLARSENQSQSSLDPKQTKPWSSKSPEIETTETCEVIWLPPLDLSQDINPTLSPALFIGFGGTGAEILTSLRSRLQSSDIDLREHKDLGWLLVDTDEKTVQLATDAGTSGRLHYEHILLTPLKSSQQYRERAQEPFAPLSRRWLYNVPRSQNTEGIRPLAMLAYLDHAQLCQSVLEQIILNLSARMHESSSADLPKPPIRVYLLGSVHGGTGSVLSIEFAFLIQQMLKDLNLSAQIHLVLTAASQSNMIAYELATAAGVACLKELNHYSFSAGLYPGIPSLPDFRPTKTPWENVFLVHGGKLGDTTLWYSAIEQVVDFLYMDACTALGGILDEQRNSNSKSTDEAEHGTIAKANKLVASNTNDHEWADWLRTIGSERINLTSKLSPEPLVKYLSLQALQPWLSKLATTRKIEPEAQRVATISQIDYFVNDLFRENRWTAQSWVRLFTETLMSGNDTQIANEATSLSDLVYAIDVKSTDLDHVVNQLGLSIEVSQRQANGLLTSSSESLFHAITSRWLKSSDRWLSLAELLEEVSQRFKKQHVSLNTVAQRFRDTISILRQNQGSPGKQETNASEQLNASKIENQILGIEFQAASHRFAGQLLLRLSQHVQSLAMVWNAQSKGLLDQFRLWTHALANDLDITVDANGLIRDDRTSVPGCFRGARNAVQREIESQLLLFVETRFSQALKSPSASPSTINSKETNHDSPETVDRFIDNDSLSRWTDQSIALLISVSKELGIELSDSSEVGITTQSSMVSDPSVDATRNQIENNELPLLIDGGAKRSILMIPKNSIEPDDLARWQAAGNSNVTVVEIEGLKSAQLYTEGEQIILAPMIQRLWMPNQERCQLADRVHSRNDIDWLPIRQPHQPFDLSEE